jgi:fatty acid desaturase
MFKLKQHVISTSHKIKRAVRISLMLPLMCSNHRYLNNHHKQSKDDDDDDDDDDTVKNHDYNTNSNKTLQIFKLKEKYV